jgi:hypothetical protein
MADETEDEQGQKPKETFGVYFVATPRTMARLMPPVGFPVQI